jgi:hypothetical protein
MIKLKIDLTKLTGARRMKSSSGKDVIVIDIDASRLYKAQSGALYADLDCVEKKEVGQYGDTHFIAESTTKEERGNGIKGAIIGNGKEIFPVNRKSMGMEPSPPNDDEYGIPF